VLIDTKNGAPLEHGWRQHQYYRAQLAGVADSLEYALLNDPSLAGVRVNFSARKPVMTEANSF
jgi:hypothetical protein